MKKCKICLIEKPIDDFQKHKRMTDGHLNQCKVCRKAYEQLYRSKNKEKISVRDKNYHENNKSRRSEQAKEAYQLAKEIVKQKQREYYKANTDKCKEYHKQYHEDHKKDEVYSSTRRNNKHIRRTREKEQCDNTVTAQTLEFLKIKQEYKCNYCMSDLNFTDLGAVHLDHIIPISKGGFHSITNVCWTCPACNLSKGSKLLEEWLGIA